MIEFFVFLWLFYLVHSVRSEIRTLAANSKIGESLMSLWLLFLFYSVYYQFVFSYCFGSINFRQYTSF